MHKQRRDNKYMHYFPVRLGIYMLNIKCITIKSYYQQHGFVCHSTKYICQMQCRFPRMWSVHVRHPSCSDRPPAPVVSFRARILVEHGFSVCQARLTYGLSNIVEVSWYTTMSYTTSISLKVSIYRLYHTRDFRINHLAISFIHRDDFMHI
jgi:hypothetical protein